jgi:hypothetical protein
MLKWALALQECQFKIIHRPGTKKGNADALSRCPLENWSFCLYGVAPPFMVGAVTRSTTGTH